MARKESHVTRIARLASVRFPPLSHLQQTCIEEVVRYVLAKRNALKSTEKQKIGNDARDISYTSWLLKSLPSEALEKIPYLRRREVREQLKNKAYPFSRLNKNTRESLLHLPISWIREGAHWQLNIRRFN